MGATRLAEPTWTRAVAALCVGAARFHESPAAALSVLKALGVLRGPALPRSRHSAVTLRPCGMLAGVCRSERPGAGRWLWDNVQGTLCPFWAGLAGREGMGREGAASQCVLLVAFYFERVWAGLQVLARGSPRV